MGIRGPPFSLVPSTEGGPVFAYHVVPFLLITDSLFRIDHDKASTLGSKRRFDLFGTKSQEPIPILDGHDGDRRVRQYLHKHRAVPIEP